MNTRKRRSCNYQHPYTRLLLGVRIVRKRNQQGHGNLHNQSRGIAAYIEGRSKALRKPHTALDGAVLVYCRLNGLLSGEDWDRMNIDLRLHSPEWRKAIDTLFFKAMGRYPDRTSARTIHDEALNLWDRVRLPYSEEQMAQLVEAWEYHCENRENLSSAEQVMYYYEPPRFDDVQVMTDDVEPEQIPHADQDRIDRIAAELLGAIEFSRQTGSSG